MSERKVVLYIAMSADGFIAKEDGDLDWLNVVDKPGEDYGYQDFVNTVDTVIMGRKTYDKVLSFGIPFPHLGRTCYVCSQQRTGTDDNVTYYNGNIKTLIDDLKSQPGKNIFIDGGAELAQELMRQQLIDRYIVSVIPYFTCGGIRLFKGSGLETKLQLVRSVQFPTGLVQLWYEK